MIGSATAPASSGNLGPGFDVIALALELRCAVDAVPSDSWVLEQDGRVQHPSERNLVVRAVRGAVDRPMRLSIRNEIPRARGLGSSSAVTAAAATAAIRALDMPLDLEALCELIADLEGHADNAAAAVYGGLVLVNGRRVRHLNLSERLGIVVAVPDYDLPTARAREMLPPVVDRAALVRNLSRFGYLIEGLRTGDPAALAGAAGDELHELPRAELSPLTGRLMSAATEAGALHSSWSGAGPAALALTTAETKPSVVAALEATLGGAGRVLELDIATQGVI